jgi:hypothetical protein
MNDIFDQLLRQLGTYAAVARALGYTERQYLNIRRKVERGEELHPRVDTFIRIRAQSLQGNSMHPPQASMAPPAMGACLRAGSER